MTFSAMRGARRSILLLAGGLILAATPSWAQDVDGPDPLPQPQNSRMPPGAVVQSLDPGPGAELRRNLSALAANPRSVDALIGAGRAALGAADGQAALGFFTRAQELAPSDPRVRAGMASALVLTERPESALVTFGEAVQLGAPVDEIAGDRGLAYDMVGDPRHAQQDYVLALRRRRDPEIERRLALSLAISGQREAALRAIDDQLRRSDRSAWRTQAFILALTGDARGADDTASRLMPPANAQAMAPFFSRLASLSPAQKAAAVHFGRFPSDGRVAQVPGNIDTRPDPGALAMLGVSPAPDYGQRSVQRQAATAVPAPIATRRRQVYEQRADSLIRRPVEVEEPAPRRTEIAQARPRRFEPPPPEPDPHADDPYASGGPPRYPESQPQPNPAYAGPLPREAPAFAPGANFTLDTRHDQAASTRPPVVFAPMQQPPVQTYQPPQPSFVAPQTRQMVTAPPRAPARTEAPRPAFSDIASVVDSLPGEEAQAAAAARAAPVHVETAAERRARDAAARETEARYRREGSTAATHESSRRSGAAARGAHARAAHDAEADTHDTHGRHARRHGESDDAASTHGRARRGHADESDTASTHGRGARGRHAADEPRNARGRTGHGHDQADEPRSSRSSRNRSARAHADESDSGSARSAHGRARHGRNTDEDSHASRSTHGRSTHSQRDADEPRSARSRSSTQQRPAAHGRRSH